MRPSTLVLTIGLLAAPLALLTSPNERLLIGGAAFAQNTVNAPTQTLNGRPTTPAPTPELGPVTVAPADRVAGEGLRSSDAGPVDSTPFSAAPSGTLSGGSGQSDSHSGADSPAPGNATPNLGK